MADDDHVAWLSAQQAAHRLGVSREWIYVKIRSGELPAVNFGSGSQRPRWRIDEAVLDAFIRGLPRSEQPEED